MALRLIDPDETLSFSFDWTDALPSGVTISASEWAISPTGPTVADGSETETTATTTVSGGTRGELYQLTNKVTLSNDDVMEQTVTLICEAR